jgi:hypothetical protein
VGLTACFEDDAGDGGFHLFFFVHKRFARTNGQARRLRLHPRKVMANDSRITDTGVSVTGPKAFGKALELIYD